MLLSVPHAGREYPAWLVDVGVERPAPRSTALEDPWVDRLIWRRVKRGCAAVIARTPRAAVDCNRAEDEVDPAVVEGPRRGRMTARARGYWESFPRAPNNTAIFGVARSRCSARATSRTGAPALSRSDRRATRPVARPLRLRLAADCHSMPPPRPGLLRWSSAIAAAGLRMAGSAGMRWRSPRAAVSRRGRRSFRRRSRDRSPRTSGARSPRAPARDRPPLLSGRGAKAPGTGFDKVAALIERLAVELGEALLGRQFATAAE